MLDFSVRGPIKVIGSELKKTLPSALDNIKWVLIIILLLGLIVGFGFAVDAFAKAWMKGDLCYNKIEMPLYLTLLAIYLQFIIWFAQFPLKNISVVQSFYI